jgi:hypothetical protein
MEERRERERGRQGDKERGRQGEENTRIENLLVPLSPPLLVFLSPWLAGVKL